MDDGGKEALVGSRRSWLEYDSVRYNVGYREASIRNLDEQMRIGLGTNPEQ